MAYVKKNWQNTPSTNTPINADNLNHMEQGIYDAAETADYAKDKVDDLQGLVYSPLVAATAAAMTDTTKVYVYTGSEAGYTSGHWYYYNGSAWADGGVYNSTAFNTDTTLSHPGEAADAEATGDAVSGLRSALNNKFDTFLTIEEVKIPQTLTTYTTSGYVRYNDAAIETVNNWKAMLLSVSEGEVYEITSKAGLAGRLWVLTDENGDVLSCSTDSSAVGEKTETITIPTNGVNLYVNNQTVSPTVTPTVKLVTHLSKISSDNVYVEDAQLTGIIESLQADAMSGVMVKCVKNGAYFNFISNLNDSTDIKIETRKNASSNKSFRLGTYYLVNKSTGVETQMKTGGDDICPMFFGGSYVGANHGFNYLYRLTTTNPHGLTEANIGEVWTDAGNVDLLILAIPSATTIDVCYPKVNGLSTAYFYTRTAQASISKDETTIPVSNYERRQLLPSINNIKVSIKVNGSEELSADGTYFGEFFDVSESYDIIYPPAMFEYLKNNVGDNTNDSFYDDSIAKYCTVRNTYRFTERGAITIFSSVDFYEQVAWSFYGITQSDRVGDGLYVIVPNSSYDTMTTMSSSDLEITKSTYRDENNPPNRFYQYSDTSMSMGMLLGYNTSIGDCTPEKQKLNNSVGFYSGSSKKMYPKVGAISENKDASFHLDGIAYRVPLVPYDADIKSVGWYHLNDNIYLAIDAHSTCEKTLTLPDYMNGRIIEVVESLGDISFANPFVTGGGIRVKVANNYGSAIVKLKKG